MRKHKVATKKVTKIGALRTGTNVKQKAQAKPAGAWLERLDTGRNMFLKAESAMQSKDLQVLVNRAKSNPVHLRVVVRDWTGNTVVLNPNECTIVVKDGVQNVRPGKGQKLLVLRDKQVQELPVIVKAKKVADALQTLRSAAKKVARQKPKKSAPKVTPKLTVVVKPLATPVSSVERDNPLRSLIVQTPGKGALAEAMKRAAARA